MIKAFKFIRHALVKRDHEELLRQIHSTGEALQTWNGRVAINHPIEGLPRFSVFSEKLIRAIEVCENEPAIALEEKTVLIKNGPIKIRLPYSLDFAPMESLKGSKSHIPEDFMEKLSRLYPFISDDASRGWATGIRIDDGYGYATNNIVIARTPIDLPDMVIPIDVATILMKIKELPTKVVVTDRMIQFNYSKKIWVQGVQLIEPWPDFKRVFELLKGTPPIPATFKIELEKLIHFCPDDVVVIKDEEMSTDEAKIKGVKLPDCSFSLTHMLRVLSIFDKINLSEIRFGLRGPDIEGIMASTIK